MKGCPARRRSGDLSGSPGSPLYAFNATTRKLIINLKSTISMRLAQKLVRTILTGSKQLPLQDSHVVCMQALSSLRRDRRGAQLCRPTGIPSTSLYCSAAFTPVQRTKTPLWKLGQLTMFQFVENLEMMSLPRHMMCPSPPAVMSSRSSQFIKNPNSHCAKG